MKNWVLMLILVILLPKLIVTLKRSSPKVAKNLNMTNWLWQQAHTHSFRQYQVMTNLIVWRIEQLTIWPKLKRQRRVRKLVLLLVVAYLVWNVRMHLKTLALRHT